MRPLVGWRRVTAVAPPHMKGAARGAFFPLAAAWMGVGFGLIHPLFLARLEFWTIVAGAALVGMMRTAAGAGVPRGAAMFPQGRPGVLAAGTREEAVSTPGTGRLRARARRSLLLPAVFVVLLALSAPNTIQALLKPPVPVLTYHRVSGIHRGRYPVPTVTPADFAEQMRYLYEHGYRTVGLDEFVRYYSGEPVVLPRKPVLITFDDGWRDTYLYAYPTLKRLGYTAAVFVVTRAVGRDLMLTWEQIRALSRAGFAIGSHTADHVNLARVSDKEALAQLQSSRQELIRQLGAEVDSFCYPYGGGDRQKRSAELVRRAGYTMAFASHAFGLNTGRTDLLRIRRILVPHSRVLAEIEFELMAP